MTLRTSRRHVSFRSPFSLNGIDGVHPAGIYAVDTDEELLEPMSFTAYRRVSTSIIIPLPGSGGGSYQRFEVDPAEIDAAELRDAQP